MGYINYEGTLHGSPNYQEERDNINTQEQEQLWFLGSLIPQRDVRHANYPPHFHRLLQLHNRVTCRETQYTGRYQSNLRAANCLSAYFPQKWLLEICQHFRLIQEQPSRSVQFRNEEDRMAAFLAFINFYLLFRQLTLPEPVLAEINHSFGYSITQDLIQAWKTRLLRMYPPLARYYRQVRVQCRQQTIITTTIQCMNHQLCLPEQLSVQAIFALKQRIIQLVRAFSQTSKATRIKYTHVWAQAICVQAFLDLGLDIPPNLFHEAYCTLSNLHHKCWLLRQALRELPPSKNPLFGV